jgi:hypothetical protein
MEAILTIPRIELVAIDGMTYRVNICIFGARGGER